MNIERGMHDDRLDAQLKRLPQWQPPGDFAARLAAAAARQAAMPMAAPPSTLRWLGRRMLYRLPLAIGAGAVALLLLALPWNAFAQSAALPWVVAACGALLGLSLAVRVLRAP
jgi:hypothetical protein